MTRKEKDDQRDRVRDTGIVPASLNADRVLADTWLDLSKRTQQVTLTADVADLNDELKNAASLEPEAPTAPAYLLWRAENFLKQNRCRDGIYAFDEAIAGAEKAEPFLPNLNFQKVALHHKAAALAQEGQVEPALKAWQDLASLEGGSTGAILEAGLFAEESGRNDKAAELYSSIASSSPSASAESAPELARRALLRMNSCDDVFTNNPVHLADLVTTAIRERDKAALSRLISSTHFAVALAAGHFQFEDEELRDRILAELLDGGQEIRKTICGSGDKRYLFLTDFKGELLQGDAGLALTRSPRGWQWSGIVITAVNEFWSNHWQPPKLQTNQPLPFSILAPWPAGRHFMAGGQFQFGVKLSAVIAAGPLAGGLLALGFSRSNCGFGPRGYYYNFGPTHDNESAFAIDFTRFRKGVPFDNESGGTPVLAPLGGVVVTACGTRNSGDSSASNSVEIMHPDPETGASRFLSRYLHLAGPNLLSVSSGMAVITGQRLGFINDTGNSAGDHLHFSIHDQTVPFPGAGSGCGGITRGASVRPTPMEGETLNDGDSGKCILSTNRERRPQPQDDAEFVSQNVPSKIKPLQPTEVSITMRNTGPTTWSAGYKLVSLFPGWTIDEVSIAQTVAPNNEVTLTFDIAALTPGDFKFQWQMSRPFTGRFGEPTSRRTVQVGDTTSPQTCENIEKAIAGAKRRLRDLQDMLREFPGAKAEIVDQIRRVQGETVGLEAQKKRLGCP